MDAYVITVTAQEAFDAFGKPGVRHCAALDTGQGFVAFDGDVPATGQLLEVVDVDAMFWLVPKIRRITPNAEDRDIFSLLTSEQFRALDPYEVTMASMVRDRASGLEVVLAATRARQPDAIWSAMTTHFLDVRLSQQIAV